MDGPPPHKQMPRGPWTVETVLTHVKELLDAYDKRYEQRFEASQKALELGFASQQAAVNAAFAAQKEAVNAALAAADRAVIKAELAADKRFEGVNEFRGQLADQQRTFIPRTEVDVRFAAVNDRVSVNLDKINEVVKRYELIQSERLGVKGGWGYAVGVVGFLLALGSLIMIGIRFIQP